MKQGRLDIDYYKEGREIGGLIVGRWMAEEDIKKYHKEFEIPQGGLLQFGSRSKDPKKYIPKNWIAAIIQLMPKLLKLSLKGYEIIGLWHIQLKTKNPSTDDYEAICNSMTRLGKTRFVLGTGLISKTKEAGSKSKVTQNIDFTVVYLNRKTNYRSK